MVNKDNHKILSADGFFGKELITTALKEADSSIKEKLREEVLQAYLNYEHNPPMDANTQPPVSDLEPVNKPFWKRKFFFMLSGLTMLAVVATTAVILLTGKQVIINKVDNSNLKGELAFVEGTVLIQTETGIWKEAATNSVLEEGNVLKVDGIGRAILNLDDGSSLRLNADTTITLTSLDPEHTIITNNKGELYSRVMKADRLFDVIANDVTYRSLGTAYKTLCDENEETEVTKNGVEVYESQVQILGINSSDQLIVSQGEKYYVVNLDEPDLANKLMEVAIEDIQLDEFVMWNKEQDEKVQAFKSQMGILFDIKAPTLNISSPMDGEQTTAATITINGTTDANTTLTVNGLAVVNNGGSFSYELALELGSNGIKIIATDPAGNKSVRNLTVTRNSPAGQEPTVKPTNPPTTSSKITLSGTKVNNGVSLTWNVTNLDTSKGFKIVKSESANPVYPGNSYIYLTNGNTRNYTWEIKDGKTYHFRVCQYNGSGTCLAYSNDITVTAPTQPETPKVTSISASISGTKVAWSITGTSASGFKVVWSKTSGPTYPNRSSDRNNYFSDPNTRISNDLSAFDGYGTYFVRVCAYNNGTNGECFPYSNEVTITLGTPGTDND